MNKFVEGKMAGKRRWAERLYSLQVEADIAPFQAGQFTKLALDIGGGGGGGRGYSLVKRPTGKPP